MRQYYIPLCSKDFTFENIFSSESISPVNFYSKRGFGIDYFFLLPGFHNENALILFNKPPLYDISNINGDVIKFILAIDESAIDLNEIIFVNEGVLGYQKTIFLNKENFKILCFSDVAMRTLQLKAEASLPTKGLRKYHLNFEIISDNDCVSFETTSIEKLKIANENLQKEITFDRHYNFFKGFIYGVSLGLINTKSSEELKIKQSLQQITNSFAELKNRSEDNGKGNYSRPISKSSTYIFEKKTRDNIEESRRLFLQLFPEFDIDEKSVAQFVYKEFSKRIKSMEEALQFVNFQILADELFGSSNYQRLKSLFSKKNKEVNPILFYDIMLQQIEAFQSNVGYNTKLSKDSANNDFKDACYKLSNFIDERFLGSTISKSVDLSPVKYDYTTNQVFIQNGFESVTNKQLEEFIQICNDIFHYSKFGKGEATKESILRIVETVGSKFSKTKEGTSSQLFQYLNNEISSYSIEKASSVVMKNFVAFVFNPNSIEKLTNFIESKGIEHEWMAFAFWGAYNGFANLSRNFVKPIFDTDNIELQQYIDTYLATTFFGIERASVTSKEKLKSDTQIPELLSDKEIEFYQRYISNKYQIEPEVLISLLKKQKQDKIVDELKEKFGILKKDGKLLIKLFKEFIDPALF